MNIEKKHNSLVEKTIRAHLRHLGLEEKKNGFIYKGDWVVFTDGHKREALLYFLEGMSIVYDSQEEFFK